MADTILKPANNNRHPQFSHRLFLEYNKKTYIASMQILRSKKFLIFIFDFFYNIYIEGLKNLEGEKIKNEYLF